MIMEKLKILDIENDGLNMATDDRCLHIRGVRTVYQYDLTDMSLQARNTVFKKDGKARTLSVWDKFVFLTDFCDMYTLCKDNLLINDSFRIGTDQTSDLGAVRFGGNKAYQEKIMAGFNESYRISKPSGKAVYNMSLVDDHESDNTKKWIELYLSLPSSYHNEREYVRDFLQWLVMSSFQKNKHSSMVFTAPSFVVSFALAPGESVIILSKPCKHDFEGSHFYEISIDSSRRKCLE